MVKQKYFVAKDELTHFLGNAFVPTEACMKELNRVLLIDPSKEKSPYAVEGGFLRYGWQKPLAKMNFELVLMSEDPKIRQTQYQANDKLELGIIEEREIGHALQWTGNRNMLRCPK